MRGKNLVLYAFLSVLFFLSSCGWFSDNPMFPKAKVSITGEVLVPSLSVASAESKNWGLTRFTFTPLNRVGVKITQCRLEYRKADGTVLAALTRTIGTSIDVIPPQTPMASVAGMEDASVTWEADLLPPDVEAYIRSNRIPVVIVTVTFSGTDYATHAVSYRGGDFGFSMLEGLPSVDLEFFCTVGGGCPSCNTESSVQVGCALKVDDATVIKKVEFSINGQSAGVDTTPPFVSESVGVSLSDTVTAVAAVYDVNGGVSIATKTQKASEICQIPSPSLQTPGGS